MLCVGHQAKLGPPVAWGIDHAIFDPLARGETNAALGSFPLKLRPLGDRHLLTGALVRTMISDLGRQAAGRPVGEETSSRQTGRESHVSHPWRRPLCHDHAVRRA